MGAHHPQPLDFVINGWFVIFVLSVTAYLATRNMKRIPSGLQNVAEQVCETFEFLTVSVIGPHGRKYTAFIGTIFSFVLISNLWGQFYWLSEITRPLLGRYVAAPTASLNTNIAVALCVFLFVQYEGIKANGIGGYLKHFAGPMVALAPLMFLIEVIGEIAKPVSLSLRLYGNIYGEEQIVGVLAGFGAQAFGVPLQFPMLIFGVFTSVVQALVFTMLTCIYLSLMTTHEEDHGHARAEGEPAHQTAGALPTPEESVDRIPAREAVRHTRQESA